MGAVYVAEQRSTGALRALKLMHPELVANVTARRRFEQEARVGSRIESDYVVQVVAAGVDDATGMPWLAMELLEGEDLQDRANREGALSVAATLEVFAPLCHAVAAAHRAGIVHRDLKPENIFLARSRRPGEAFTVKVLDFGIARIAAEAVSTSTAAVGTPLWMSPEQTERGGNVIPATDVWALGLIAFYLLTNLHYWRAANDEQSSLPTLLRELAIEPLDPATARARVLGHFGGLPAGFDAWFARCVARDPAARFPDAGACLEALRPVLSAASSSVAATAVLAPGPAPAPTPAPTPLLAAGTTSGASIPNARPGTAAGSTFPARPSLSRRSRRSPPAAHGSTRTRSRPRRRPPPPRPRWRSRRLPPRAGPRPSLRRDRPRPEPTTRPALRRPRSRRSRRWCASLGDVLDGLRQRRDRRAARARRDPPRVRHRRRRGLGGALPPLRRRRSVHRGRHRRGLQRRARRPRDPSHQLRRPGAGVGLLRVARAAAPRRRRVGVRGRRPPEAPLRVGRRPAAGADVLRAQGRDVPHARAYPSGSTPDGLHDMTGDVREWTTSDYCFYDRPGCTTDLKVTRGGTWFDTDPRVLRNTVRQQFAPATRSEVVGFRCARPL